MATLGRTRLGTVERGTVTLYVGSDLADNTELVAAVTGKSILVVQLVAVPDAAGTVFLTSGASTVISPVLVATAVDLNIILPYSPCGWCQTTVSEALKVQIATATTVDILLGYVIVDNRPRI